MTANQNDRLKELIEFAQQSALLRSNPVANVTSHGGFLGYEHSIANLPGMHFDVAPNGDDEEIWLVVERLHQSSPPQPESVLLKIWINLSNSPTAEPRIKSHVEAQALLNIGAISAPDDDDNFDPSQLISIDKFEQKELVEKQFKAYFENIWKPWAAYEKLRRRTMSLYSELFTLHQQLEGDIVDAQRELVWGAGVAVWNMDGAQVTYPLVSRLVEVSLNETTMSIEVRPRDIDPRVELDIFSAANNPGVPGLEAAAKEFFAKSDKTFSPFDRSTYEPLLRSAVTHLDANGVYWPAETSPDDRSLPKMGTDLKISDTWVLFTRPRSASIFIQDLERFKKQIDNDNVTVNLPRAVAALVTDPATTNETVTLPPFRGISMVHGSGGANHSGGKTSVQDLFFPMPFNDEQVRVVQLLECNDGVVVQGPPGTGKTHTIANIICHYLALGKRVLVTSMKDPALAVLHEKLPEEIRPLAISLLTSEQAGMKQFEFAVSKIASEVQAIDRISLAREISQLEGTIDAYHAKLAKIDSEIGAWAVKNLSKIDIDGETLEPRDAAEDTVKFNQETFWPEDPISIGSEFRPQFTDADIIRLRKARREVASDIDYFGCSLPLVAAFPDSRELLRAHQDLSRFTDLQSKIDSGEVFPLADSSKETFEAAQALSAQISNLRLLSQSIENVAADWTSAMATSIRSKACVDVLTMLEALGAELDALTTERKRFLARPVVVTEGIDQNAVLVTGIQNLANGKKPFGLAGIVGKGAEKKVLDAIRVLGSPPGNSDDWGYVLEFTGYLRSQRETMIRWNAIAGEVSLPLYPAEPSSTTQAEEDYRLYCRLMEMVQLEEEIVANAKKVLPGWKDADSIPHVDAVMEEAEATLHYHLTRNRLAETWVIKERFQQILSGCSGRVVSDIQEFITNVLGSPAVSDSEMQGAWTTLMEKLRYVNDLQTHLDTIRDVSALIERSGAPKLALRLCNEPATTTSDSLLPDNWREAWRMRRLATFLDSIDCRADLKRLTKQRTEYEADLARCYQEIATKQTWLRLEKNATPDVRSALMAYMSAIGKIGKGTGKRAVRYRQDARKAADRANPAIPCWIMPHYRVSESQPAEFGCYDLVVIDEASQSDLTALPAILRAKKVLIVGDDKQVSPDGVGLEEEKVRSLMARFLSNQVETFRPQMTPERSIYDLFKVVFAKSAVMLKEHFRCVAPIVEYSKREFYNHELKPLRLPKASERINPPLVDVIVEDGFRKGDINLAEARFIVDEIKAIVQDNCMAKRSIGVVSLLADKQALKIWDMLQEEIGHELIQRHKIACGDARTFQGKERDIMFLSMVISQGNATALSRDTFAQRFNVAGSRARDRMYLVRSMLKEELSHADNLRRNLISHFAAPFAQDEARVSNLRELCESPFEREVYDVLVERGYRVIPQVPVGEFRIDMVVEGHHDNRLAIECDGDRFHGPDRWEDDMRRQRILERAGWRFWRCFASTFVMHRQEVVEDLVHALKNRGIEPIGAKDAGASIHTEQRRVTMFA